MLEPWCKLVNRILELAHQIIPNLPPLVYDDLEFYAHHLLPFKAYHEFKTLMAVIGLSRSRLRTWYNRDHVSEQSSPRPTNIRQPNVVFRVNFDLAKCSFHEKRMHDLREAWREYSRAARKTGSTLRISRDPCFLPPCRQSPRRLVPQNQGPDQGPASCFTINCLGIHSTIFHIDHGRIQFIFLDDSGVIMSKEFSWVLEIEKFAAIPIALCTSTKKQLGLREVPCGGTQPVPSVGPPGRASSERYDMDTTREEDKATAGKKTPPQYCLAGREAGFGSVTFPPSCENRGDEAIPGTVFQQNLGIINEGRPTVEPMRVEEVYIWTEKPVQLHISFKYKYKTSNPFLEVKTVSEEHHTRAEPFVLTIYQPLTKGLVPSNFCATFRQLANTLQTLYIRGSLLRKALCLNSLMYEIQDSKPEPKGQLTLLDYDLSTSLRQPRTRKEGIESKPIIIGAGRFTSVDLLRDSSLTCRPYLRHDFESIYFVALWCTMSLAFGPLHDQVFEHDSWNTPSACIHRWTNLQTNLRCFIPEHAQLGVCMPWLEKVRKLVFSAYWRSINHGNEPAFDFETFGGEFTYEKLVAAMDEGAREVAEEMNMSYILEQIARI